MRTSYIISSVITLLLVLWVGSAILYPPQQGIETALKGEDGDKPSSQKERTHVRVQVSKARDIFDYAVVTGRTQAHRSVDMASEINARVDEVLVEEGAFVKSGDVLAVLATDDRAARVSQGERLVNQRQIEYNAAKSLERKGFNSQIRLAEARADLESARADLKLARQNLSNTKIRAPFEGILSRQMIEVGDYARQGDVVFTLVDLNPIEMVAYVSERNILNIEQGSRVVATFLDGREIKGALNYIAPAADAQTRTFRVIAQMDNADMSLRDGLTAELKIPMMNVRAHYLPASNLTLNDEGALGLKIVNAQNIVEFKPVRVVSSEGGNVYVAGLADEVSYISVGAEFVADGELVDVDISSVSSSQTENEGVTR